MRKLALYLTILLFSSLLHAETLNLKDFSMAHYQGQYLYLDFWASWCGPCRASFPWMNQLHKDLSAQGLKVVAVNLDSERQDAMDFLDEFPATFTVVFDPEGELAEKRQLMGMPSSYFYDPEGNLLFSHVGFNLKDKDELRQKIESVLGKAKGEL